MSVAARLMQGIEEIVSAKDNTVGTVGQIEAKPGGINIIPKEVIFTLDLRDSVDSERKAAEQEIKNKVQSLEDDFGVDIEMELLHNLDPVPCDEKIVDTAEASAKELGIDSIRMISGAAHDAMNMASITSIGMLFIPSYKGLSHRPDEWSEKKDCGKGAKVLFQTVKNLDRRL